MFVNRGLKEWNLEAETSLKRNLSLIKNKRMEDTASSLSRSCQILETSCRGRHCGFLRCDTLLQARNAKQEHARFQRYHTAPQKSRDSVMGEGSKPTHAVHISRDVAWQSLPGLKFLSYLRESSKSNRWAWLARECIYKCYICWQKPAKIDMLPSARNLPWYSILPLREPAV